MRIRFVLPVLLLGTLLACGPSRSSDLALVHAKIYPAPTEPAIEDGTILVHDGRITAIGPSTTIRPPRFARAVTVINCKGLVVTAGFWNSHVHILTPGLLHPEVVSANLFIFKASLDYIGKNPHSRKMKKRYAIACLFVLRVVCSALNSV